MQLRLTLECREPNPWVPLNYQYELSAWIYRVLREADAGYARFLHDEGYAAGPKMFKLFCFSNLDIPKFSIEGDRLRILSEEIGLFIRFCTFNAVEGFIEGLFYRQEFWLGDRRARAHFRVKDICATPLQLPDAPEPLRVRIRMRSPLLVARKRSEGPDEYLAPDDPDFGGLMLQNLLDKYQAFTKADISKLWPLTSLRFRLCTDRQPRSKLVTLKQGTPQQTRVRGWMMDFEITAPRELIAVGMLAGWGRANSQGFGYGDILPSDRSRAKLQNQSETTDH
ncbi:MAG: CRISPR-associated endoribonuclease Cas6 [Saprospiraceae bacterium]|nr:CRISPR-associated endoribonuclease Cas6 [Saprospiraceae bacterium]MDW8230872.1 CRISPR-associated endoribonuclease Cas6 [Saprospiraceae bacterium]